jgi:hypothetical protein
VPVYCRCTPGAVSATKPLRLPTGCRSACRARRGRGSDAYRRGLGSAAYAMRTWIAADSSVTRPRRGRHRAGPIPMDGRPPTATLVRRRRQARHHLAPRRLDRPTYRPNRPRTLRPRQRLRHLAAHPLIQLLSDSGGSAGVAGSLERDVLSSCSHCTNCVHYSPVDAWIAKMPRRVGGCRAHRDVG